MPLPPLASWAICIALLCRMVFCCRSSRLLLLGSKTCMTVQTHKWLSYRFTYMPSATLTSMLHLLYGLSLGTL